MTQSPEPVVVPVAWGRFGPNGELLDLSRLSWGNYEPLFRAAPASPDPLLEEAAGLLKPFAAMSEVGDQKPKDDAVYVGQDGRHITYGDLRRARAFLTKLGRA